MAPIDAILQDLASRLIYVAAPQHDWSLGDVAIEVTAQLSHNTALPEMLNRRTRLWMIPGEAECRIYQQEPPGFRQSHVSVIDRGPAGMFFLRTVYEQALPVRKVLHADDLTLGIPTHAEIATLREDVEHALATEPSLQAALDKHHEVWFETDGDEFFLYTTVPHDDSRATLSLAIVEGSPSSASGSVRSQAPLPMCRSPKTDLFTLKQNVSRRRNWIICPSDNVSDDLDFRSNLGTEGSNFGSQ